MQIVSAAADGLIKLWQVRTADCAASFEEHDGKVWAMDMCTESVNSEKNEGAKKNQENKNSSESSSTNSYLVTGGEKLVVWQDCTVELEEARVQEEVETRQQQVGILFGWGFFNGEGRICFYEGGIGWEQYLCR